MKKRNFFFNFFFFLNLKGEKAAGSCFPQSIRSLKSGREYPVILFSLSQHLILKNAHHIADLLLTYY